MNNTRLAHGARTKRLSGQPHTIVVEYESDPKGFTGYFAYHPELEGCMAQGATPEEALASLAEARRMWIAHSLKHKLPVPAPRRMKELIQPLERAFSVGS
jgi:predicted RNase H-like HicB family nuclease